MNRRTHLNHIALLFLVALFFAGHRATAATQAITADPSTGILNAGGTLQHGFTVPAGQTITLLSGATLNAASGSVVLPTTPSTMATTITVGSITALRGFNVTSFPNGGYARTAGYYLANDGGGGVYVWSSTSTATDNGGTVIQATGVATGRWLLQYTGPINVRWFGAKGDGATDDTAALQSAINYATSNALNVFVPAGSYLVSTQGSISFGAFGTKPYAILVQNASNLTIAGSGTLVIPMADASTCNALVFSGCSNVTVQGLKCSATGSPSTSQLYVSYLALFYNSTTTTARDLTNSNCAGPALWINCTGGLAFNCLSANNHSLRGFHLGSLGSNHVVIDSCNTYYGTADGDIAHYGAGYGNAVVNCHVVNVALGSAITLANVVDTSAQGICVDSGQNGDVVAGNRVFGYFYGIDVKSESMGTRVTDNFVEYCGACIAVRRGEANHGLLQTVVKGNTLYPYEGNGANTTIAGLSDVYGVGVWIQDGWGTIVADNFIGFHLGGAGNYRWAGIVYQSGTEEPYNGFQGVTIANNRIDMVYDYAGQYQYSKKYGIYVNSSYAYELKIDDNVVRAAEDQLRDVSLVYINGAQFFSINNNTIDEARDKIGLEMVNCTGGTINANTFTACSTYVSATTCTQLSINGNRFKNTVTNGAAMIVLSNAQGVQMNANAYVSTDGTHEGKFLSTSGGCSDLQLVGNRDNSIAYSGDSWFSIEGLGPMDAGLMKLNVYTDSNFVTPLSADTVQSYAFNVTSAPAASAYATIDTGTSTITITGHGYSNGDLLGFTGATVPSGLAFNTVGYYVINATTDTFQVSLTPGGSAVSITTTGSNVQSYKGQQLASVSVGTSSGAYLTAASGGEVGGVADVVTRRSYALYRGAGNITAKENTADAYANTGTQNLTVAALSIGTSVTVVCYRNGGTYGNGRVTLQLYRGKTGTAMTGL